MLESRTNAGVSSGFQGEREERDAPKTFPLSSLPM